MREKGVMRCHRSFSGEKTLKRCQMNGKPDDVVLTDVDGDNVIIIDVPESMEENLRGSSVPGKVKEFPCPSIISIDDDDDDDDDDDETNNETDPGIRVEGGFEMDGNASSSKSHTASEFMHKSGRVDDDDCWVIKEKKSAFKSLNIRKANTAKTPCGKRYGLGPGSENSSSESDHSDCEIIEDSSGKLHEEWEKAFQRRKYTKNKSSFKDQIGISRLHNNNHPSVEVENRTHQYTEEGSVCSSSSDSDTQKQNPSSFAASGGLDSDYTSYNGIETPSVSDKEVNNKSFSGLKNGSVDKSQLSQEKTGFMMRRGTSTRDPTLSFTNQKGIKHVDGSGSSFGSKKQSSKGFGLVSNDDKHQPMGSPINYRNKNIRSGCSNYQSMFDLHLNSWTRSQEPSNGSEYKSCSQHINAGPKEKENLECRELEISSEEVHDKEEISSSNAQCDDRALFGHGDIILEREKLKETDEYKQAVEKEWLSRQRELRLQAEEAQRLRKRRKAESMRLLDMERRQKQRVEEMREIQKKDEENMNLKEEFRAEVRKELSKLELTCIDMASLLRSLGIHVDGPLSHEVNAAYKRALLRFHPDRASRTDIRQQVEAEEKFKLISRMKEKFLSTSCH